MCQDFLNINYQIILNQLKVNVMILFKFNHEVVFSGSDRRHCQLQCGYEAVLFNLLMVRVGREVTHLNLRQLGYGQHRHKQWPR